MIKIIVSWALVMSVLILGKYTPFSNPNHTTACYPLLTGFIAGTVGMFLGMWGKDNG